MKISKNHSNRKLHNWLVYDIGDKFLLKKAPLYKGVMYDLGCGEAPYDFYRYSPYGLKYMFEKAGFTDVVVDPQSGFFTTWVMKFNYFSRRFVRGPKPLKALALIVLVPFWTLGQLLAPWLDKLDRNWSLESAGYYVTARKP